MAGNSKNVLPPYPLQVAADMSTSLTSRATNIGYLDNVSIQLSFTGSPTGTFSVQGSLNHKESNSVVQTEGDWMAITLSPTPTAAGAPDNILIDLNQLSFPWIRVVYTRTGGTGSLNSFISGKSV